MHITIGNLISMLVIKPKLWTSGTVGLSSKFESPKKRPNVEYIPIQVLMFILSRANQDRGILATTYIRPFDTPSDFPISKEKWSLGHMDEISDVRLLLSRLNLTSNWFKVWPKFEFEFSLPLLWLVNSKIFRN